MNWKEEEKHKICPAKHCLGPETKAKKKKNVEGCLENVIYL